MKFFSLNHHKSHVKLNIVGITMALGVQVSKGKHQRVWEPPDAEGDILKLSLVYKLRGTLGMQLILTGALARTLCY